ncbi:MAG TPA: hypothetical protein VGG28_17810 [Kofleriaceae bacterium]|jgi:hypothetical protein
MADDVDAWVKAGERRQRRWLLAGTITLVLTGIVIAIISIASESNAIPAGDTRAIDAVEAQGFHAVILGGADLLACAKNESSRHFSATNPDGKVVEGAVCCGLTGIGKGCTLRWR